MKIDYKAIFDENQSGWRALTDNPQEYEALLAGHYSDCNHFVYELLQNAEDAFEVESNGGFDPRTCAHASDVVIEYYNDKLIFFHNGKPFDQSDVRGVSSMLKTTKNKDDFQTIGRFGMGFKSVFKYTDRPEIYSDDEAFIIKNYLLPEAKNTGWDYISEKEKLCIKISDTEKRYPFKNSKHLTKIVIPFSKYGQKASGADVLRKLEELNGEILLFLTRVKSLYWINKVNGEYKYISLSQSDKDTNLITCRITGTSYGGKEEISRYLLFKKIFDHENMSNAEVSVAYKLNSRTNNINSVDYSPICVYFPTREMSGLPFLIHGSFQTAVSREKLVFPSPFNDYLFNKLGDLIAETMSDLAQRKLITQTFLRNIVVASFGDEKKACIINDLKDKITRVFKRNSLLPDRNGEYQKPSNLKLPVPFRIGDFADKKLIENVISAKAFVAINNEKEAIFGSYYKWLVDDLHISLYKLSDLANDLFSLSGTKVTSIDDITVLDEFYDFLSENRESVYTKYAANSYETAIKQDISSAWERLRNAPIILNQMDYLVSAYKDNKPSVYLSASSKYKNILQSELVNSTVTEKHIELLSEGFRIKEFNNFQFVKEKIVQKYIEIDKTIGFEDREHYETEYIEDITQIIELIEDTGNVDAVKEMLNNAFIIKVKPEEDSNHSVFSKPKNCFVPFSDERINLNIYFAPVADEFKDDDDLKNPDNWDDLGAWPVDADFYEKHDISMSKLAKLGLITSPVNEGSKSNTTGTGDYYWKAIGEYCPKMEIKGLVENITYIEAHPNQKFAKEKSAEILSLLLKLANKMKGKVQKRKINPYKVDEEVWFLSAVKSQSWLFDREMNLHAPCEMSRYDLNRELYGNIVATKAVFEILGFIEKTVDETEETIQRATKLNTKDKKRLLEQLAQELGVKFDVVSSNEDEWGDESNVFNPTEWVDDEFPVRKIVNIDYLIRHVQEQFFCADPASYRKVWRQIRVSKNPKADRSYVIGMYTNSSGTTFCQICKKIANNPEAPQITNYGIEMPQLNLCLCRECSAIYKGFSLSNKDKFKEGITKAILSLDVSELTDDYSIVLSDNTILHFTQTHLAEVQEIIRLLNEYGVPSSSNDDVETSLNSAFVSTVSDEIVTPNSSPTKENGSNSNDSLVDNSQNEKQADKFDKVPQGLKDTADECIVYGDLHGDYIYAVYKGSLKQYVATKSMRQMFLVFQLDIKPKNILVTVDEKNRIIYVPYFQYKQFQPDFALSTLRISSNKW